MANVERQQTVLNILQELDGLDGLKRLFWQELNYERQNKPLSPRQWPEAARQALAEDPVLFASGGEENAFHIVYCRLTAPDLRRGPQRPVVNQLLRDHPYALFVFSNKQQSTWHFLNVKFDEQVEKRRLVRRITVRQGEGLRTAAERLAMLDLQAISPDLFGLSPLLIQQHHDEAFDVEKVTKDFYGEIANWYFWAREHAQFAKDAPVDADGKPSLPLIRLLTRLIFCWFLKEKRNPQTAAGLIPDTLFDPRRIRDLLKDPSPESCSYYTAVLQNLFFATLSTEMDRPGEPPSRRWIEEGDGERSDDHMIHTVWRHARQLRDPAALEKLLRDIPFLNGGLFECLDDRVQKGNSPYTVEVRIDGYATDPKKQPKLPNSLFYGAPQAVDLSDAYGDSSRRRETVRPLLDILNRYNFTLTENTPFDQEVALDPELLGHVFENLLAAFNPETGTVARKATGSFYTPRVVVDWMVDQALLVYLKGALEGGTGIPACASVASPQTGMSVSPSDAPLTITRRNLPHWTRDGAIYWVTFRLADSIPQEKLRAWKEERDIWMRVHPEPWSDSDWREYDERFGRRLDEWLDAGYGSRALARADVRDAVRDCLVRFNGERVRVHAAVIMPTHVHAVIEPLGEHSLSELLHGIKGASARQANKILGTAGTFWMDESYDHIVRSQAQYEHFRRYIAENPVKANLGGDAYWLYAQEGGTDIPVCAEKDCAKGSEDAQAGMPVPPSLDSRLKRMLSWEDDSHDFQPPEVERLIDAVDGLKAIDPACGSGAFPMGMLQKLAHVLKKLDPENKGWRKRQEKAARAIESSTAREEAVKAIQRAFARDNDDYGRKLYLIENCLYGVDIQPIAVQIAKLRFFISLVVDQSIDPHEENYGILPLPNLETKVVAANTLLGLHRGQLLLGSNEVKRLEGELQKVRHDYFTARSYKRKKDLRKEDKRLCDELAKALEASGECTPYDAKRLAGWNPYDTNTHAPFFDPGWMFGLASKNHDGVFDVVIGNPPYVRQEELKNQTVKGSDGKDKPLKDALKGQYECFTGTADLYVYFFERSLQLLHPGGVLSFITSNKYFRAAYGERLRTYLAYATRPSVMLDFGDAPVFTSIAYPAIIVAQKTRSVELGKLPKKMDAQDWESQVMTWTPGPDIREFPDIFERDAFALAQTDLKPDGWRMENPIRLRLLERLRNAGKSLGENVQGRFYRGVTTGLNEAFVVDRSTRDRLIAEHKSSDEILKPFLRGRDVKRWRCEPQDLWLIFTRRGIDIKMYPAIHEHLKPLKKRLTPGISGGRKPGSYEWYEIQDNTAYWESFEIPGKIVFPDIAATTQFAWDTGKHFIGNTGYMMEARQWSLPVLNSQTILWFYRQTSNTIRGGYLRFISQYVEQIPIPPASSAQQSLCARLAEALIWMHSPADKKAKDAPTGLMIAYLEQWLNGLVYELFFPGELHARRLRLFDETAKINPPDLAKLRAGDKLTALQELHERAYAKDAALRGMLFDLKSLDVVRVIEDVDAAPTGAATPEEAKE
jgi:REP element-mobilizing transposase RayT